MLTGDRRSHAVFAARRIALADATCGLSTILDGAALVLRLAR